MTDPIEDQLLPDEESCYKYWQQMLVAEAKADFNNTYSIEDRKIFDSANAFISATNINHNDWLEKHTSQKARQHKSADMLGNVHYEIKLDKDHISQTDWYSVDVVIFKDNKPYILIWLPCEVEIRNETDFFIKDVSFLHEPAVKDSDTDTTVLLPNYDILIVKTWVMNMVTYAFNSKKNGS
ncbi:MAG: hypothetical protein ACTJGV_02010 [Proteus vulgaris]